MIKSQLQAGSAIGLGQSSLFDLALYCLRGQRRTDVAAVRGSQHCVVHQGRGSWLLHWRRQRNCCWRALSWEKSPSQLECQELNSMFLKRNAKRGASTTGQPPRSSTSQDSSEHSPSMLYRGRGPELLAGHSPSFSRCHAPDKVS